MVTLNDAIERLQDLADRTRGALHSLFEMLLELLVVPVGELKDEVLGALAFVSLLELV